MRWNECGFKTMGLPLRLHEDFRSTHNNNVVHANFLLEILRELNNKVAHVNFHCENYRRL